MAEELGLWSQAADRLSWLGRIAMLLGDYVQARELYQRGMQLATEQSYKAGQVFAEIGLGLNARREGKFEIAETHFNNVLDWHRRMSYQPGIAHAIVFSELGFLAEQRGDATAARVKHLAGLAVARRLGDLRAVALALEGLSGAQAVAGRHDHAAQLLGAAAALRKSIEAPRRGAERGDVDRIAAAVRTALGDQAFAIEFERGTSLEPEQAWSTLDA
jgi:tetratricopeptide (TPR) repeat protein